MPIEETLTTIMHMIPVALILVGIVYAIWDVASNNQYNGESDGSD